MIFNISANPIFQFTLGKVELMRILDEGQKNYDITCKSASLPGGFIYEWLNRLEDKEEISVSTCMREMDLLLKICEEKSVHDLHYFFYKAVNHTNDITYSWKKEIEIMPSLRIRKSN